MATAELTALMTAEEFGARPDPGYPEELVRGEVVPMPLTDTRHGEVCVQSSYLLKRFLDDHDLGRVIGNDAGVITTRGPDSVRGPDVAFFSYARIPKGPIARGYQAVVPFKGENYASNPTVAPAYPLAKGVPEEVVIPATLSLQRPLSASSP